MVGKKNSLKKCLIISKMKIQINKYIFLVITNINMIYANKSSS